jgi:hypothetical protein
VQTFLWKCKEVSSELEEGERERAEDSPSDDGGGG